ncbi:DUF4269 domain-containing protein [Paenibacillus maysiensis]|uniref:DUF4269 domain-containing protein n=1 Tax=Paenibacillus maysiensis TaxID=1155954 RepID=UPI0004702C5A|nr:DUF4269 domain-containing protein [Paenibacillus maysiensis]
MFKTITYLKSGNEIQRRAFNVINGLGILNDLAQYHPVLCGTIPISIDVEGSDLDIIMEVHEFEAFKHQIHSLYCKHDKFVLKEKRIRNTPTIKANFEFGGFELELFGQPRAVEQQNAYLHMMVEHHLLTSYSRIRNEIIRLKEEGVKTEPAFAQVFGLEGDPYDELLVLGRKLGVIDIPTVQ